MLITLIHTNEVDLFDNKVSFSELLCPHRSLPSESPALNFQPQLFVMVFYIHFSPHKNAYKKQWGIPNVNALSYETIKKSSWKAKGLLPPCLPPPFPLVFIRAPWTGWWLTGSFQWKLFHLSTTWPNFRAYRGSFRNTKTGALCCLWLSGSKCCFQLQLEVHLRTTSPSNLDGAGEKSSNRKQRILPHGAIDTQIALATQITGEKQLL